MNREHCAHGVDGVDGAHGAHGGRGGRGGAIVRRVFRKSEVRTMSL